MSDEYLMGLFNGIALVIDDCIDSENETDRITVILDQLRKKYIPFITEIELPRKEKQKHYTGISFVILDWNLQSLNRGKGIAIPDDVMEDMYENNISFIKEMKSQYYCPIFIFTNEEPDDIANKLVNAGIPFDENSNVFIKRKSELLEAEDSMIRAIVDWIKSNSSMYVLKEWEREYQKAKSLLFNDFQRYHTDWAKVIWMHLGSDGGNKSIDLGEIINKNLLSRMSPFQFKDEYLVSDKSQWNSDEIRGVIQAEKFINKSQLNNEIIGTGDFFEYYDPSDKKIHYLLNIRAQCDLMDRSAIQKNKCQEEVKEEGKEESDPKDKIVLYCIEGEVIPQEERNNYFSKRNDYRVKECSSKCVVTCLYNKQDFVFLFDNLRLFNWEVLKNCRIGRLLPPYITNIQQRFASYIHRQGLPVDPRSIFEEPH